jgi:spore coat polysaccharide biosynthesis protein SpsF
MNIGIIIQARLSSTRLPNKIMLDFCDGKNILEIIYERIKNNIDLPVIIATTTNDKDTMLVEFLKKKNILYYRGSESDVLSRFISAAEYFKLTHIIRICSDNPFLYINYIKVLVETMKQCNDLDYISYKIADKPSILTHYGFFSELASMNALYLANEEKENKYHEHVTNYIYTHEDKFKINWINAEKIIEGNNIRLTVDDETDFMVTKSIYKQTGEKFDPESIINILDNIPDIKQLMEQQIKKHTK